MFKISSPEWLSGFRGFVGKKNRRLFAMRGRWRLVAVARRKLRGLVIHAVGQPYFFEERCRALHPQARRHTAVDERNFHVFTAENLGSRLKV
jgi:hypothetical protein